MNSPTSTTRSDARRRSASAHAGMGAVAAVTAALLWAGCGGSGPEPGAPKRAAAAAAAQDAAGEAGEGNVSFHYSNKSTDANLAIDLGSTDLYLEMTGRPNPPPGEEAKAAHDQDEHHASQRKKEARPDARPASQDSQDDANPDPEPSLPAPRGQPQAGRQPPPNPHAQAKPEAPLPEDDQGSYEDVTSKVLTGIRKAQELFYQKRYPEAMQAVRSSLDARSTAEGHALAGSIYYMQSQGGMARREWLEALRLNPDMPAVVNMLEKTRTPGGRGSPNPRPIVSRPAPRAPTAPLPEADQVPYPEEYTGPQTAAPVPPSAPWGVAAPESSPMPGPAAAPAPAAEPVPAPPAPRTTHLARPTQAHSSAAPAAPPSAPANAEEGDTAAVASGTEAPAAPVPAPAATPLKPDAAAKPSASAVKAGPVLPKSMAPKPEAKPK